MLINEPTAVYRLFSADGRLLYIGMTRDPVARWKDHERSQPWWPEVADRWVTWYDTRDDAMYEEREAILAENPVHNEQRIAVIPAEPERVYRFITYELVERLEAAAGPYMRARMAQDRAQVRRAEAVLAPIIYEALSLGCRPSDVARPVSITKELSAAICRRYTRRHPELPPVPSRAMLRERMLERVRAA